MYVVCAHSAWMYKVLRYAIYSRIHVEDARLEKREEVSRGSLPVILLEIERLETLF